MLSAYTSYNEVRSVLGVEDDELLDETLDLPVYLTNLLEDLSDTHPRTVEIYENVLQLVDPSPLEQRFKRIISLFSTYSVAKQLTTSLPMFAPRSIGDGKATMSRFLDPYKDTIAKIEEQFTLNQGRLQQLVDELSSETRLKASRRTFIGVGLARDPITGA